MPSRRVERKVELSFIDKFSSEDLFKYFGHFSAQELLLLREIKKAKEEEISPEALLVMLGQGALTLAELSAVEIVMLENLYQEMEESP